MNDKYLLALGLLVGLSAVNAQESDKKTDLSSENEMLAREVNELKKSLEALKTSTMKSKNPAGQYNSPTATDNYLMQYRPGLLRDNPGFWPLDNPNNLSRELCLSSCCQVQVYKNWAQSLEKNADEEIPYDIISETTEKFINDTGLDECQSQAVSWMIYFDSVNNDDN